MRVPSRRMPAASLQPVTPAGYALLAAMLLGFAWACYLAPWLLALPALIAVASLAHNIAYRRTLRDLASRRGDGDIGAFARDFDCRSVDTWIIRAVYEELQACLGSANPAFPLRATDRIAEDLHLDDEDLEDVAVLVAERAGYDLAGLEKNPLAGKVTTVGELVQCINHQPCLRS